MNVVSEGVHNEQSSAASVNGADKSEVRIDTLEPASTGSPLPGKKFLPYTDDAVNYSSLITLSNRSLSGTTEVKTIRLHLKGSTEELINLHQKENVKLN